MSRHQFQATNKQNKFFSYTLSSVEININMVTLQSYYTLFSLQKLFQAYILNISKQLIVIDM